MLSGNPVATLSERLKHNEMYREGVLHDSYEGSVRESNTMIKDREGSSVNYRFAYISLPSSLSVWFPSTFGTFDKDRPGGIELQT